MYLLGWFVVGFVLASCAMYLGRGLANGEGEPDRPARTLEIESVLFAAPPIDEGAAPAPPQPIMPLPRRIVLRLALAGLLIFSLLLLWFAAASDQASLWDSLLWLRSPFLGARFQYLIWGGAIGVLTQLYRQQIGAASRQAFDATIGATANTAWALQGTLALLIIAAVVLAIKPDLLNYVRSFEYGGFKATFAEHSTTARSADLNYKDLLWGFTLDRYQDFDQNYVGESSARARFSRLFYSQYFIDERKFVTRALFPNYVDPVVASLICLERNHPTKVAAFDLDLIEYGARWVGFLSNLKAGPEAPSLNEVKSFLSDLNRFAEGVTAYVHKIVPACPEHSAVPETTVAMDAVTVSVNIEAGLAKLKAAGKTQRSFQTFVVIEPYLIAATGDLVAVLHGQKEKAEFLTRMLDGFPDSIDLMTPGIVNAFYQVADAQLQSFEKWPVDKISSNLDFAIKAVDQLIAKTSELYGNPEKRKFSDTGEDVGDPAGFFGSMNRNLMILLALKLSLFNQRALAGETLSQESREDWLRTYSRIIANRRARSEAPILALDDLPSSTVDEQSKKSWPTIEIESEYLVDINLSTAVSSVLLERTRGAVSAAACNTSLYYLNGANRSAKLLLEKKTAEAAGSVELSGRIASTTLQLQRILNTIHNWAGIACDWSPDLR
jgi:hypothetical protein